MGKGISHAGSCSWFCTAMLEKEGGFETRTCELVEAEASEIRGYGFMEEHEMHTALEVSSPSPSSVVSLHGDDLEEGQRWMSASKMFPGKECRKSGWQPWVSPLGVGEKRGFLEEKKQKQKHQKNTS